MDAYDIFKKLTKGLSFKRKVLGVRNNEQIKKEVKPDSSKDIKPNIEEILKNESNETSSISDHDVQNSDSETDTDRVKSEPDNDIQLMEGVTIGEKKKKKKKVKSEDLQKKLQLEEENRYRNEHGIKTVGRHVPAALKGFEELCTRYGVQQGLVDTVVACGYSEPTPVQRQAMPCMLEDRQILACAPTGSGKTAAFLVPILHSLGAPQGGPRALVLCPTRELAHQIYREALRLSSSTELRCSVLKNVKESKVKERESTIRKSDIVISTPNRICYLLNRDNVGISLDKVRWLIIDEADKLFEGSLDEQSDFRQQMEQIMNACVHTARRVAMFSATHTPRVAHWARHHMRGLINITVGQRNAATHLVDQELLYCGNENGKLVAFRQLVQNGLKPPVLVFVQSKDRAKQLFKELIYDGINVDVIHADRTQAQRDNVVRSFRVGRIWVLICTELMGRGIDFRGVNLVVNYDFPPSAIAYIHSIAAVIKQSGCEVPEYMLTMKQDNNERKKLLKKAPQRDKISTILERKRKLEPAKNEKESNDTDTIKNSKNKKYRKVQKEDKLVQKKTKNKGKKELGASNKLQKNNKRVIHNKKKVVKTKNKK